MIGNASVPSGVNFYALERLTDRDVGLRIEKEYAALQRLITDYQPDLLVIDPLRYAISGDIDEKTTLTVLDNVSHLREIKPAMATVLVHHKKKSQGDDTVLLRDEPRAWIDKVYGSQALLAHVETIFGLEKEGDSFTFATVARSQAGLKLTLTKEDTERFALDSESKPEFTDAEKRVFEKLPDIFIWKEALELVGGKKMQSTLSRTLRKAESAGVLLKDRTTKTYKKLRESLELRNHADNIGV
jgi:hypothetical protein